LRLHGFGPRIDITAVSIDADTQDPLGCVGLGHVVGNRLTKEGRPHCMKKARTPLSQGHGPHRDHNLIYIKPTLANFEESMGLS
jgi:hypothetical protein